MLIFGFSSAMASHTVTSVNDTLVVHFGKGKPGSSVTKEDVLPQVTPTFRAQLDSVLAGQLRIVVESSTDPTEYKLLQILERDPRYKDVDFRSLNINWDGATNVAREGTANRILQYLGVNYTLVQVDYHHVRSNVYGDRFIKIHCAEFLPHQQRVIEKHTERIIERPTSPAATDHACTPHLLDLSYLAGLRTTEFAVSPTAEITLTLNNQWLLQFWGIHSSLLRTERDTFLPNTETLDQGGGIRLGTRAYKSLWILGGAFIEENILTETTEAGKRPWWYSGADLSIALRRDHYAIIVSGMYGHEWNFEAGLDTSTGIRFAVVAGDTRRIR